MIVTRFADTVQAASFVEFHSPGAPPDPRKWDRLERHVRELGLPFNPPFTRWMGARPTLPDYLPAIRSEEHTSELQSLMRISYAVFCLKKKNIQNNNAINSA